VGQRHPLEAGGPVSDRALDWVVPRTARGPRPAARAGERRRPLSSTAHAVRGRHEAPAPPRAAPFRPDIEGMRALAVVLVLGFHADLSGFGGGFIGVDVFFVISGYLISALLLSEATSSGSIDLAAFYARRALRIVPSVALVIVVTGVAAWFLLPPLTGRGVSSDMLASALFVANWEFIAQGNDYLAASIDHGPLLHLWSLGVEEQFYLVWPVLLLAAAGVVRGRRPYVVRAVAVVVAVVSAASLAASVMQTPVDPSLAYFGTHTRAWQFGAGALLALAAPALARALRGGGGSMLRSILGWAGAAGLVACAALLSTSTAYPGAMALLPVAAALALIAAGGADGQAPRWSVTALLGRPAVRAVGRISFAWYLWHWPCLVLWTAMYGAEVPGWVPLAAVLLSVVPAYLSLRFVEQPVRYSAWLRERRGAAFAVGGIATAAAVVAALALGNLTTGELERQAAPVAAPTSSAAPSSSGTPTSPAPRRTGGPVTPAALGASDDVPQPIDCQISNYAVVGPPCRFGPANGPSVVLFGDSHAQQWQSPLIRIARQRGWSLTVMTKSGCPVAAIASDGSDARFARPDCAEWRALSLKRMADELHPSLVIVASRENYVDDLAQQKAAWSETLTAVTRTGAAVVHIRDTPWVGHSVPACISGSIDDWDACSFPRAGSVVTDPVDALMVEGSVTGVEQVDLTEVLCPDDRCPAVVDGVLVYRDESHLSDTYARSLTSVLGRALAATGALPTKDASAQP
jgi:peptidoglycan/LPS O-acetylase OafA/YrhL